MLRILAISDIHGCIPLLEEIIKRHKDEVDLIVFTGDLFDDGVKVEPEKIEEIFPLEKTIFVPGNCDNKEVFEKFKENNIDRKVKNINGYKFCGLGGCLITPWNTSYEWDEEEIEPILQKFPERAILVSHSPAKYILDQTKTKLHVGSEKILEFIEEKRPLLVICGHVHEARGIMIYKDSLIVNPGCYGKKYVIIEIDRDRIENVDLIKIIPKEI